MMDQIRWFMCLVDACVIKATYHTLKFLNEWFSISQGTVEKFLISPYVLGCVLSEVRKFEVSVIFLWGVNTWFMWGQHRTTHAERRARMFTPYGIYSRWFVYALSLFMELLTISLVMRGNPHEWELILMNTVLCLLYIVTLIPGGGERGKRRKAALAKAKEIFGSSWIVAPLPQPR